MSGTETEARDCVVAWIVEHQNLIAGALIKSERQEEPSRKLVAWFETPKYLIDICAWDNAACLDIGVLDKTTQAIAYSVAGSCEGAPGLVERLDTFLEWLNINEPNRLPPCAVL